MSDVVTPPNKSPDAEPDVLLEVEQLIAELEHGHGSVVGERVTIEVDQMARGISRMLKLERENRELHT